MLRAATKGAAMFFGTTLTKNRQRPRNSPLSAATSATTIPPRPEVKSGSTIPPPINNARRSRNSVFSVPESNSGGPQLELLRARKPKKFHRLIQQSAPLPRQRQMQLPANVPRVTPMHRCEKRAQKQRGRKELGDRIAAEPCGRAGTI